MGSSSGVVDLGTLPDVNVTAQAPTAQTPPTPTTVTAPTQASGSFVARIISLVIQLGTGSFGNSGSNTLTLGPIGNAGTQPYNSLRCVVQIQAASAPFPGLAIVQVWGLSLDTINQLSIAGLIWGSRGNYVAIQAGDSVNGLTTIFTGEIVQAYQRANQPEMPLVIVLNPAYGIQLTPANPTTFSGPTNGVTALTAALKPTKFVLENNGVSAILSNPYFHGSAWDQVKAITAAMGAVGYLDSAKSVYAIWPQNGNRTGGNTPLISPQTGMIGYPEFQQRLIRVRTLFDPHASLSVGHEIQVESQLKAANGTWPISTITHDISAQLADGPWETSIVAVRNTTPGS